PAPATRPISRRWRRVWRRFRLISARGFCALPARRRKTRPGAFKRSRGQGNRENNMKKFTLIAASALALSCGMAAAQAPGGGGGRGGMLMAADANKDGVITKAEFDTMRSNRFAALDTNKDGFLVQAEMAAGRPGGPPPGAGAPPGGGQGRGNMDANN